MTMIRRATSGKIENVAEMEDKSSNGAIVCKACSHVVFKVNLGANGNCPYCHRDVKASIEKVDIPDALADDDEDDVIAVKC
jgi:acetyl-CoA carboxylase beta subunit